MKAKALFVCRFSDRNDSENIAASAAGDLVQQKIIIESKKIFMGNFYYIAMSPNQSWPKGEFFIKGISHDDGVHVSYINAPVIKNIFMMMYIFYFSLKLNPNIIFQYNSYFFENIAILLSSCLIRAKNFIIMQDYRDGDIFSFWAKVFDQASNKLVRYFDLCMPVTIKFSEFLKIKNEKSYIFIGGTTEPAYQLMQIEKYSDNTAIFAGALEPHNGIDKILEAWNDSGFETVLHVFGKGSLSGMAMHYSEKNKNIVFHGFVQQEIVLEWQKKSKFNLCLRYSIGIDQDFFFPSKFFNTACCHGLMILNDFNNVPIYFKSSAGLVKDDLSNLKKILEITDEELRSECINRRKSIVQLNSWGVALKSVFSKLGVL